MAKNTPDRIIDTPETPTAGRASQYSAGATSSATTTADHTHSGAASSGGTLAGYSATGHSHGDLYYTEAEVDALYTTFFSYILTDADAVIVNDGEIVWSA